MRPRRGAGATRSSGHLSGAFSEIFARGRGGRSFLVLLLATMMCVACAAQESGSGQDQREQKDTKKAEPETANAAEAQAKSFTLPRATAVADVQPDGSVVITENITYDFSGSFEGGYREILLKDGMSVSDVSVSENGSQYAPGASAELGSSGAPGTYGTANLGNAYRIVWHYRAADEERTFTVSYRLSGLAVAYDDVVDVYWQAWGDEWQEPLDSLDAAMNLPGDPKKGDVKVFGHPASVSGETSLGPGGVSPTLVASDVPPEQFVEMRVVFPRAMLTSTSGARVESGSAPASPEATLQNTTPSASSTASSSASAEATGLRKTPAFYRMQCRMDTYAAEQNMDDQDANRFADELADRLIEDMEAGGHKDVDDIMDDMGVPAYEAECG